MSTLDARAVGERIAQRTEAQRLTQRFLAERIGTHQPTVNHWMRGRRLPTLEQAVAIARFFDVSLDELLLGRPHVDHRWYRALELIDEAEAVLDELDHEARTERPEDRTLSSHDLRHRLQAASAILGEAVD